MKLTANLAIIGLELWLTKQVLAEPITLPSGKHNVGRRRHTIEFVNSSPVWPNNVSTEYMVTLFYPTSNEPSQPQPYLEPELAEYYAEQWGLDIAHLTSTMSFDAPFLSEVGPTLLFSPGAGGPPADGYSIQFTELASHGYVVAALDHLYEMPFVRLPNGTGVHANLPDVSDVNAYFETIHETRVRELLHFIDYLPKLATELQAPFNTSHLGAFGFSLGGSAALTAAYKSDAIAAAINQDGSNWNRLNETSDSDLKKPSFLFGSSVHTQEMDPTWGKYYEWQTGWWRHFNVNHTGHLDFSDASLWKEWGTTLPDVSLGPIDGQKMGHIVRAYVKAFFDKHLLGREAPLLDGEPDKWPEVMFIKGNK
jgi:hypothetical protein